MMKRPLLAILATLLTLPLVAECWISRTISSRHQFLSPISPSCHTPSRHWQQLPPTSPSLRAQKDKDGLDVVYNDDAFGLVFLSAFFVAKDYTFAACFGALSMLAVIAVQFGGVAFNPLLPGIVALSSLLAKSIMGNVVTDVVPEDVALPVELGASIVSLVWGFIQSTRNDQDA